MEQLIKIKDNKIQSLVSKLQQAGINWYPSISLLKYGSMKIFWKWNKVLNFSTQLELIVVYFQIQIDLLFLNDRLLLLSCLLSFLEVHGLHIAIEQSLVISFDHFSNIVVDGHSSFELVVSSLGCDQVVYQSASHQIYLALDLLLLVEPVLLFLLLWFFYLTLLLLLFLCKITGNEVSDGKAGVQLRLFFPSWPSSNDSVSDQALKLALESRLRFFPFL